VPKFDEAEFDVWMKKVDKAVIARSGVSIHDLADQPFADWFEDGISPSQAAKLSLESEGW
jgi:hypothetical protein